MQPLTQMHAKDNRHMPQTMPCQSALVQLGSMWTRDFLLVLARIPLYCCCFEGKELLDEHRPSLRHDRIHYPVHIEPRSHIVSFAKPGQSNWATAHQCPFPERWHCHARARLEVPQEDSRVQLLTQMQDEDSRQVPHHALPECTCTVWKHLDTRFLARLG
ncbi:unnamed protein product [Polarella glacialis]|uniref:Uncharacterized protein n=1 Tax=Polarella glacialis TaxID=89957 RepID=A0A813H4R8_POLGL|nr:unnamed protein product [Polarella glacialis]